MMEVEHCLDSAHLGLPNSDKLRMPFIYIRSQTASDKIVVERETAQTTS